MRHTLIVAAVQPATTALDVDGNAAQHARAVRRAEARVVVFPELSLTGYELAADAVPLDHPALAVIAAACDETGAVALVDTPIAGDQGRRFIAILRVDGAGASVAYRKTWLGDVEAARFAPGDGPTPSGSTAGGWGLVCARTLGRRSTRPASLRSASTRTLLGWCITRTSLPSRRLARW